MSRSPFMHSNFFSSLKQVEERLKIENPCSTDDPPSMTESLSSPIYLINVDQHTKNDDTELPCEFVSAASHTTQNDCTLQPQMLDEPEESYDIQLLMQLLHPSCMKESEEPSPRGAESGKHCCDTEFHSKVVGTNVPQCQERLDSWIKYLENGNGGKTSEPLRLAHLLLAKAAYSAAAGDNECGIDFPSTLQHFLLNDPPSNCEINQESSSIS